MCRMNSNHRKGFAVNKNRLLSSLGQSIRNQRQQKGLSQEGLAAVAEFDRTYISLIERGKRNPSFTNLYRLAEALGVSIGKLTERI